MKKDQEYQNSWFGDSDNNIGWGSAYFNRKRNRRISARKLIETILGIKTK